MVDPKSGGQQESDGFAKNSALDENQPDQPTNLALIVAASVIGGVILGVAIMALVVLGRRRRSRQVAYSTSTESLCYGGR